MMKPAKTLSKTQRNSLCLTGDWAQEMRKHQERAAVARDMMYRSDTLIEHKRWKAFCESRERMAETCVPLAPNTKIVP